MKSIFVIFLLSLGLIATAQTPATERKVIHVTGSAEMEVIPDELYFKIVLQEYMDNKVKVTIGSLEDQLQKAVAQAGLDPKSLELEKVYGKGWEKRKRKQEELIENKTYLLKVSDPSKIDLVLDKLDAKGVYNVYLSHYSHSKIIEYRKQMKIQAIKNAKEKATYLLEAIGEKVGGAVTVTEIENGTGTNFVMNDRYVSNNAYHYANSISYNEDKDSSYDIQFKTVKIRFEIAVDFEIK
jgi:uncharacterized protein YggE